MADQHIVCALSGVTGTDDDYADTDDYTGADSDLPEGWTKVVITTRRSNPAWEAVQEVKEITAMNLLGQVPEEAREDVEGAVMLQIEAQFAALEARPEYARTLTDAQTLYIAPAERVDGLDDEIKSLCETLGIDADLLLPEDDEGDDGEDDEGGEDGDNADQGDETEADAG
jgi:hypothetical protein